MMTTRNERHTMQRVVSVVLTSSHVRTQATYGVATLDCGHRFSAVVEGVMKVGQRKRCHTCRTGQPMYCGAN
jgi:hypothetical protein